jgi:hypothetical protein
MTRQENFPPRTSHTHWRKRVEERIGAGVDADWLFFRLRESIGSMDGWATRKAQQPSGREVWYFKVDDVRHYAVVAYHPVSGLPVPITVLGDYMTVHRGKGKSKTLRAPARYRTTNRKLSRDKVGKKPNAAWFGDDD